MYDVSRFAFLQFVMMISRSGNDDLDLKDIGVHRNIGDLAVMHFLVIDWRSMNEEFDVEDICVLIEKVTISAYSSF